MRKRKPTLLLMLLLGMVLCFSMLPVSAAGRNSAAAVSKGRTAEKTQKRTGSSGKSDAKGRKAAAKEETNTKKSAVQNRGRENSAEEETTPAEESKSAPAKGNTIAEESTSFSSEEDVKAEGSRSSSAEESVTAEDSKASSLEEDTTAEESIEPSAEDNTAVQQGTNVEENGTADQDIYDVILFFGQSNMVGESLKTGLLYGTDHASIAEVSARTGVDMDILMNTQDCQMTYVPLQDDTAYQYSLIDDEIYPIEAGSPTGNFGRAPRAVAWNAAQGQWTEVYWNQNIPVAFGYSDMINMVPEFCHTYYQRTGHKVIAVSCALGGVPIRAYLPMDDRHYQHSPAAAEVSYAYMYKGVVDSFTGAVQKAQENGWTIGGKYFVSFQGEADLYNASYNDAYMQVIRQWQQMGITDGALVETSFTIGDPAGTSGVRAMHTHQEQLVAEHPDIVLGSSFDYDHYVPDAAGYNSYWKKLWNNISYEDAYTTARYLTDAAESNRVHLNSAALSQIGRETAENLADHILP